MGRMDERHLEMELNTVHPDGRIVKVGEAGYYIILPNDHTYPNGRIFHGVSVDYLGHSFVECWSNLHARWPSLKSEE